MNLNGLEWDKGGIKLRTARKEHRCHRCERPIGRGGLYFEYLGESHAYESGDRYHVACAIEAGLVSHRA